MTCERLWYNFLTSAYFSELKPRTEKDYYQHEKKILAVFGKMKADNIKTEQVRTLMDTRGLRGKTQANQELASMSRVYGWGFERGYVKSNPCRRVRKFSLESRDVYITDTQYNTIYSQACPEVKVAMEIAYLCAARLGDILNVRWSEVMEQGLYIQPVQNR